MDTRPMTAEEAQVALRAMIAIATADGREPLSAYHRSALSAFQRHVSRSDLDVDALPGIAPLELAEAIPDAETRAYAIHDLAFMALADPDADGAARMAVVDAFAAALDVHPPVVTAAHHAVRQQTLRLQLDALRMLAPTGTGTGRIKAMWEAVAPYLGVTNAATAARYRALAAYPDGTLGRAYHDFITSRGLSFPGEKRAPPEGFFVAHDLTHILSGYGTDRDGEVAIIGFQAGYTRQQNPLQVILLALVQVQLGIVLDPVAPAARGELDFDRLLAAWRRGTHVTVDFMADWRYWDVMDQPVDELRKRYGVLDSAD